MRRDRIRGRPLAMASRQRSEKKFHKNLAGARRGDRDPTGPTPPDNERRRRHRKLRQPQPIALPLQMKQIPLDQHLIVMYIRH